MPSVVHAERKRVLTASKAGVWQWMINAEHLELFTANIFHSSAKTNSTSIRVDTKIDIEHTFGFIKELRVARITRCTLGDLAWGEAKAGGEDWFPHSQRLRLVENEQGQCVIHNRLDGAFRWPLSKWWLTWWYKWVLALVLDAENRKTDRLSQRSSIDSWTKDVGPPKTPCG